MKALTLRIEPELNARLEQCAEKTRIKKYTLAILALEAAVNAMEANDYRLVVPIEFQVSQVPVPKPSAQTSYPSPRAEVSRAEDKPAAGKKPKAA